MDCQRAAELMPWLLNGTLPDLERDELRAHLATCSACAEERRQTQSAVQVFSYHIPSGALVDYAFGRASDEMSDEAIERHLAMCPECVGELDQTRRVRTHAERPSVLQRLGWSWPPTERFQLAAAAAVVVLTVANVGIWMLGGAGGGRTVAALQTEIDTLRAVERQSGDQRRATEGRLAVLEGELARLNAPAINPPVVELFPVDLVSRAEPGDVRAIEVPRDATSVTLILSSPNTPAYPDLSIEIVDSRNVRVWSADGLIRHRTRDFTIMVPSKFLVAGDYRLDVSGRKGTGSSALVARYLIRVQRAAP